MDATVASMMQRVLTAPKGPERDKLMAETNSALGAHFGAAHNHGDLAELAFSIVGLAWADAMTENVIDKILDVKNVALEATDYIDDRTQSGLMAYWQGKGGRIMSGLLRYTDRTQMPRESMVSAIEMHADEIATDFWGKLTDLQAQAEEKLRQLPVARLVALIGEALPTGSTVDGLAVSGTFPLATATEANLDSVINTVAKKSKGSVAILGSENALGVFGRLGGTYVDLAARIFTEGAGIIGQYKGRKLVTVANFDDQYGVEQLPDNELWIVGKNAGRLTFYGGAKTQVLQLPAFYRRWETERDAGMLLHGASAGRIGRIILS
jgi:hypothetical protein